MKEEPTPSDLNGHGADGGATGLGDALVEGVITALIGSGREAGEAGDLTTVLDLTPGEELEGEEPGGLESDALERHELADEFECGVMSRGHEAFGLELLDETDTLRDIAAVEPLTFETLAELGTKRGGVEEAEVVELVEEPTIEGRDREALGSEETLDAVGNASAVGLEREEFAVKVAGVLGLARGHMDDGPDTGLAVVVANEHREELVGIDAVGLEASEASVNLDRGGVDDEVEAVRLRLKKAMDPEAVSARLEAGDDGHGVGQLEAFTSESNLPAQGVEVSGWNVAEAGLLAVAGGEGQFPGAVGEFEREIERRWLGQRGIGEAGRRGHDAPLSRNGCSWRVIRGGPTSQPRRTRHPSSP